MARSARSFDRMIIPAPCDADWDVMIGNERVRFCEHCHLHVTNLSALTRMEAMRLVSRSEGRLCVRFIKRADGSIATKQIPQALHHISRRVSRIAAGAFTATLSLSSAAAQTKSTEPDFPAAAAAVQVAQEKPARPDDKITLRGTVLDQNGAVIPGASIELINSVSLNETKTTSSDEGQYVFNVPAGTYTLKASAPGFAPLESAQLNLKAGASEIHDVSLEVAGTTVTVGALVVVQPSDPLIKAAFDNDLDKLVELLPTTLDINASDKDTDTTALAYAVGNNNINMVHVLISAGALPNGANSKGETPLMHLSREASVEFLTQLIAVGADVKAGDNSGRTVLMDAARFGNLALIKELIDCGARIDDRDEDGNTVLMSAAENGNPEIIRFLIKRGVPLDYKNDNGESAVSIALNSGLNENFKALVEGGAALTLGKKDLNDALIASTRNGDLGTTKFLLTLGADANAKDDDTSVLMLAADSGGPEMIKALIDAGADLDAVDDQGWTAMMYADEAENVRVLLNAGASAAIKNKDGETALGMAIKYDQTELIQLLKSRGAPR